MTNQGSPNQITDEYRVLHKVAKILESQGNLIEILQNYKSILAIILPTKRGFF